MEKIKAYMPLVIFICLAYLGYKLLPPYFSKWQFEDFCESEARLDTYNTKSETDIRRDVLKSARDNGIPITDDQIHVSRANGVSINTQWSVHVDLPVHPVDLNFTVNTANVNPIH